MPLVNVTLVEGVCTEKQKHDMAARLTDVMVAFQGREAFRGQAFRGQSEADALMLPSVHAVYVQRKAGTVHLWPRTAQLKYCQAWTIDSTHRGGRRWAFVSSQTSNRRNPGRKHGLLRTARRAPAARRGGQVGGPGCRHRVA